MYKDVLFYSNDWCEVFLDNKLWLACASSCNSEEKNRNSKLYCPVESLSTLRNVYVMSMDGNSLHLSSCWYFVLKKSTKRKSRKCWHKLLITLIYRCSNVKHRMLVKKNAILNDPYIFCIYCTILPFACAYSDTFVLLFFLLQEYNAQMTLPELDGTGQHLPVNNSADSRRNSSEKTTFHVLGEVN